MLELILYLYKIEKKREMSTEEDEKKLNFNTRKKGTITSTSELMLLKGDLNKMVDRETKDRKNDNIFHACPDDLKYI